MSTKKAVKYITVTHNNTHKFDVLMQLKYICSRRARPWCYRNFVLALQQNSLCRNNVPCRLLNEIWCSNVTQIHLFKTNNAMMLSQFCTSTFHSEGTMYYADFKWDFWVCLTIRKLDYQLAFGLRNNNLYMGNQTFRLMILGVSNYRTIK